METKVQKNIIDYFSFFEEFFNTAKTCLKICQTCAVSINKLIYRCENIKESNLTETPLEKLTDLKAKLLSSLYNLIAAEIQEVQTQLSIIEELFEKLCHKNKIFQDNCKDIDLTAQTPLVKGTPLQPPLSKLLTFASDTVTFGGHLIGQVETALSILSFKGSNIKKFADNFKIPANWQKKISEIIAYTSFCSENEI